LRGKDEIERAELIIANCAHEAYRDQLRHYLNHSTNQCRGHHPQLPVEAYSWYVRLKDTGSMLS
ncbi:MAG: hypothetical protein PHU23_14825, partial [Dehalococcoidales bacterium]|nr:hypothetical protein [Dehalococcoidales bacterium]